MLLEPADQESMDLIKGLSKDDVYYVEIKKQRNYEHLQKVFVLFKLGYDNIETNLPFNIWRKIMIMKAGFFKAYDTGKGTYYEADSLSYASMSSEEFESFYKKIVQVIANEIGVSNEELEKEILTEF